MNKFILKHNNIFCFLFGSLAVQALPPFYHWYFLFISFSGLLLFINKSQSSRQSFACGYWFGFGYFAFGLGWVQNALLIDASRTGWLIPIVFLASGGFFGLFIGLPALLTHSLKTFYAKYLAFSTWIVIFEWIRSWFLTGFPWNLLGSSLAFKLELIQTASVWGVYGLSWLVVLIATAPAIWLQKKTLKNALLSLIIILLIPIILFYHGQWRLQKLESTNKSDTTIRLVQPSIPQNIKWSPELKSQHFKNYITLTTSTPLNDIDMVIWGETASPYALDKDTTAMNILKQAIPPSGYLMTGQIRYEDDYYGGWKAYNSSLIINDRGVIEDFYDKAHLVPFGEYIPFREWLPQIIQPIANIIGTLHQGQGPKIISIGKLPPLGTLICYEIIFPHQLFAPSQKPELIINLTNDGWYGNSSGPYQHFVSAQFRAIEEGISIVRTAGSGISGLIDYRGQILAQTELNQKTILDITLPQILSTKTLYNKFGNTIIIFLCSITLLCMYYLAAKHK